MQIMMAVNGHVITKMKFKPGDKVIILDKNYGADFESVESNFKMWHGDYGVGWIISVYENFYVVGYTAIASHGDFYEETDLKHYSFYNENILDSELFEI